MRSIFLSKPLKGPKQTLHDMDILIPDILLTTFVGAGVGCLVGWAVGYK
jgi:hypothetical protein